MLKPTTETMAADVPINKAKNGVICKFDAAPTATPPARVAFWMSTVDILPLINALTTKVVKQLAHSDITVLTVVNNCWF